MSSKKFIVDVIDWGYCHNCGSEKPPFFIIRFSCPFCTVDVSYILCKQCLRKLIKEAKEAIKTSKAKAKT